jgi:hypothetical protein
VIPSQGHLLLALDCSAIELHALATYCLHRHGESRLAEELRRGIDPLTPIAELLLGVPANRLQRWQEGHDPVDGTRRRVLVRKARRVARRAISAVCRGQGLEQLIQLARLVLDRELTQEQARALHDQIAALLPRELLAAPLHSTSITDSAQHGLCPIDVLVSEAIAQALFALVRHEVRVVLIYDCEVLLELADEGGFVREQRVREAMEVIDRAARSVRLKDTPVLGEAALCRRWSLEARWACHHGKVILGESAPS